MRLTRGASALFAVLEGRIEPVRLVDGIERVLGERHPGDVFGEVPIVLGTVMAIAFIHQYLKEAAGADAEARTGATA